MKKVLSYMILFAFTMNSCVVYHPHTTDIPLLAKKGDARINGGFSLLKWHATVSAAVTDKIAVQTFGDFNGDKEYYLQQAVGYYKDLGNKKVMEIYTGFGYGYGDAYNHDKPGHLNGNYQVYFTQFNLGKIDCEFANTDLGFAFKTGILHSKLTDRNYYATEFPYESSGIYKDNCFLIEPQAFLRLGGEKMKVCLQVASTRIYKFTNKDLWFPYFIFNVGLGFNYRF